MINSNYLGGDDKMRKTIVLTLSLVLMAGASQAQAGKPKPVVSDIFPVQATAAPMTSSAPSTTTPIVSSGRTITGRPADLDPRISWLDDLGMPQSGGPEPLVKVREINIAKFGSITSLAEIGGYLAMMESQWILNLMASDGTVKWSKMLPGPGRWGVLADDAHIYAVPIVAAKRENSEIHVYNLQGIEVGTLTWPLLTIDDSVADMKIHEGVIIGDLSDGRRIHARIDPKSTVDPDDILTVGDVGVNSEINADEYKKNYKAGYAVLGARLEDESYDPEKARKLNDKHRNRAGKLRGHRIQIGGLPMFDPNAEYKMGDYWKPRVTGGEILSIGVDGSLWTRFGITNPNHLSRQEMDDLGAQKSKSMDAYRKMGKAGVVLFYPDGRLRSWYLYSGDEVGGYPAGDAIYIERGYMTGNERLVRLEPMKAK